jgi:hypothetical protein
MLLRESLMETVALLTWRHCFKATTAHLIASQLNALSCNLVGTSEM